MGAIVVKRIPQLDIAKGIGIILVVLGHALPTDSFVRLIIYSFHMPLFFFLSGLTLKKVKPEDNMKDIVQSEHKLFVTYIFYTIIFVLFDIVVRLCILHEIGIRSIVWNCYQAIVMFGVNVLWFLSSLLLGKILVRFLIQKNWKTEKYIGLIVTLFFVPSFISLVLHNPDSGMEKLVWYPAICILRTFIASSFILAGYLYRDRYLNSKNISGGGTANEF